jgi:hypothetical protein
MDNSFFDHPILNSPYNDASRHWELDLTGQPMQKIVFDKGIGLSIELIETYTFEPEMGEQIEAAFGAMIGQTATATSA